MAVFFMQPFLFEQCCSPNEQNISGGGFSKIGNIEYAIINAGYFYSDGGAAFGVLPRAIWQKQYNCDEKHRVKMQLNLLLIKTENKLILLDTGVGNRLNEKEIKIYSPYWCLFEKLEVMGINREDITDVVLTHLHFDHAGGVLFEDKGRVQVSFKNAVHHINKTEYEMAKKPDELNKAAYNFEKHLNNPEIKLNLIDGDYNITPEIKIVATKGHSVGMQSIKIRSGNDLLWYAGDILPSEPHINLPVCSSYDVSREQTFKAKQKIIKELKLLHGKLILNHDPFVVEKKF